VPTQKPFAVELLCNSLKNRQINPLLPILNSLLTLKFYAILACLLLTLAIFSCQSSVQIPNFETQDWKSDAQGCQNLRSKLVQSLYAHKDKLMDLEELELRQLLGTPNQTQLIERQQKQYIYFVSPSSKLCQQEATTNQIDVLQIRLNAIQRVNEVVLTKQVLP
jgi:hypothetical protein